MIVVVEIFIPQRQAQNALTQHDLQVMFQKTRDPSVAKTLGEHLTQTKLLIHLLQQETASFTGEVTA